MPGARILIVEDDPIIRDLVVRNLAARGHEVSVAGDAHSALSYLRTEMYNLVVLDINLPDQTGWDVLRSALQEKRIVPFTVEGEGQRLPVVVLSAVRVSPRRLAEFQPLAYLPKPFPMEALLRLAAEAAARRNGGAVSALEDVVSPGETMPDEEDLYA